VVIKRQQTRERGAVALITAMIVSVLLMITTAGMVSLTLKSLRGSTDGAQSTKAYYAAEGGLEEALLNIRNGKTEDICEGKDAASSAEDGVVTCTLIDDKPSLLTGELDADQTVQLDLSAVNNLKRIKVEWSQGANLLAIPNYTGPDGFRAKKDYKTEPLPRFWSDAAPAVLEFAVIEYPKTGNDEFSIDQVDFYESILAPKSSNASFGMISQDYIAYSASNNTKSDNRAYIANCVVTGEYQCTMGVGTLRADKRYVLRLKTRYNPTRYRITALGPVGNDTPLNIPGAMYTVDVTARAGDVFRRIQTSFPKDGKLLPTSIDGLDYVLYSDTNICKSFEIKGSSAIGLGCQPPI
jgi:Tfp pilus assembly protein PilX